MKIKPKYYLILALFAGFMLAHYMDVKSNAYQDHLLAVAEAEKDRIDAIQDSIIRAQLDSIDRAERRADSLELLATLLEQQRQRLISQQKARQVMAQRTQTQSKRLQISHAVPGDRSAYEERKREIDFSHIPDKRIREYVARFHETAVAEQRRFGIPASIKLAQGILESTSGTSRLARNNNNHFGIKCHKRGCKRGHCSPHHDDSPNDRFIKFQTAWFSFRAHSYFLTENQRYAPLFADRYSAKGFTKYRNIPNRNYRKNGTWWYGKDPLFDSKLAALKANWNVPYKRFAYGLDLTGYATSNRYAESLINTIEKYNLQQYDN